MTNQKPTADEILTQFMDANEAIKEAEERLDAIKLQIDTVTDELLQLTKSLELPLIESEFENPSWHRQLGPY
jgi:hypothetical protein